jgi:hypothetical protein
MGYCNYGFITELMEIESSYSQDNNGNTYRFSKDIRNIYLIEENNELTELPFHRQLIVYRDFINKNEGKLRNWNGNFYTNTKYNQIEKNIYTQNNFTDFQGDKIMIYSLNHDSDNDFNDLQNHQDDIIFIVTMFIAIFSTITYLIIIS